MDSSIRRSKKCKGLFGSHVCQSCGYYVPQYVDAEPRQIKLFMMGAEQRATAIRDSNYPLKAAIVVLLIIGIPFGLWVYSGYRQTEQLREGVASGRIKPPAGTYLVNQSPPTAGVAEDWAQAQIRPTLSKVARDLKAKKDVNHDGLVNCIDAAVLFYQYYPDKSLVCIEVNRNDARGWHHLFNCVKINGTWRAIEPQAGYTNRQSYWMRDVWPEKYNSALNRDVTTEYLKYVK